MECNWIHTEIGGKRMHRLLARRGKQKRRVPNEPQGKGFRLDGMHGERKPSASPARMQDAPLYPAPPPSLIRIAVPSLAASPSIRKLRMAPGPGLEPG